LVDTIGSYLTGESARGAMILISVPPFKLNSFGDLNSGYIKLNPSLNDISTCVFETSEKIPTFWSSLLGKIFCTGAACKIIFEPCTIFIKGQTEDTCRAFIVISRFISTGL